MSNKINVGELLRKYAKEDDVFYCSLCGNVKLYNKRISWDTFGMILQPIANKKDFFKVDVYGTYLSSYSNKEMILFPSKDQRDWAKWAEERELENQKGTKETTETSSNTGEKIFAVGDRVYDVFLGWGEVVSYGDTKKTLYPVFVSFDSLDHKVFYTENGATYEDLPPRLSFTEYDLVNGGFSQKRSLPDIPMYTPIFVKGFNGNIFLRIFHHWSKENNPVCLFEHTCGISKDLLIEWDHGYFLELPEDYKVRIETDEEVDN